jgi:hypothetical protein
MTTPPTAPDESDDLILAIGLDNLMIHAGPAGDVLEHVTLLGTGVSEAVELLASSDYEFYTITGHQISLAELAALAGANPLAEPEDDAGEGPSDEENQQLLLARIGESVAAFQQFLDDNPDEGDPSSRLSLQFLADLVQGGNYPAVLVQLSKDFGLSGLITDPPGTHRGSALHNLWHKATGT